MHLDILLTGLITALGHAVPAAPAAQPAFAVTHGALAIASLAAGAGLLAACAVLALVRRHHRATPVHHHAR
jgi:hypothetical protein